MLSDSDCSSAYLSQARCGDGGGGMHPPSPPIPQQHPGPRQDSWVLSREEEEEVMAFGARSHPAVGLVPSALAREEGELRALFYYFFGSPKISSARLA